MKPGERIPMIAEAAKDLLTRPWAEAQLILDQFGFHTYESEYNIDEHSYFIQQIKDGEDGQVAGLYGYLRGEKVQTDPADAPWSGQPLRLFLSHIHQERVFAGNLKEALAGYASTASSHTTTSSRASGGVM